MYISIYQIDVFYSIVSIYMYMKGFALFSNQLGIKSNNMSLISDRFCCHVRLINK